MSVEIQRKLGEILKKRHRDETDFQLKIILNPLVYDRLRTEDERLIIEMEKHCLPERAALIGAACPGYWRARRHAHRCDRCEHSQATCSV